MSKVGIRDEFLFDFNLHMPRILVSGRTAVVDNVRKIVMISDSSIIADCGKSFIGVNGKDLIIEQLEEERMLITGEITGVEFYGEKKQ